MVHAEDVINIYQSLSSNGIQVWLTGGWGIDALLREQTRSHKDLDIIMLLDDIVRMRELLGRDGYDLKELWSENSWGVGVHGTETPTAFVLQDSEGHEVDVHAMYLDNRGNGIPAWADDEGFVFKREDLAGEGMIGGFAVRCLSPEMQMLCHTGYELPDEQVRDLQLLQERFGVK
jgi:lincosamide nucleotidyltransferase A/C/D/E